MGKQPPKMTALVVSAIRNLREVQGSTPKEILKYILAEYNASNPTAEFSIERKLCTALKRGLEYGILKQVHNHYSLNTDPETVSPTEDMLGPMERGCKSAVKRKPRRAKASGCKSGGGRKRGGRKRGGRKGGGGRMKRRRGGGGAACGGGKRRKARKARKSRSKGGGCKSRGGKSRRGKSRKSGGKKRRGGKRGGRKSRGKQCPNRRGGEDMDILAKDAIDTARHRDNADGGTYAYERDDRRSQSRGRQSGGRQSAGRQSAGSRSRSRSRSRSSGSSDRGGHEGTRRDRQGE